MSLAEPGPAVNDFQLAASNLYQSDVSQHNAGFANAIGGVSIRNDAQISCTEMKEEKLLRGLHSQVPFEVLVEPRNDAIPEIDLIGITKQHMMFAVIPDVDHLLTQASESDKNFL